MPYPVECLLEVNEDVIEVLLVLEVLLAQQYPKVEDLLCCAAFWSEGSDQRYITTMQQTSYN